MKVRIEYLIEEKREAVLSPEEPENEDLSLQFFNEGTRTKVSIRPKRPMELVSAVIEQPAQIESGSRIFVNGYQSWTDTKEFTLKEELHSLNKVPAGIKNKFHFEAYGDYRFNIYKKGVLHGYTFAYIKNPSGDAQLVGSYNEENAFLIIRYDKNAKTVRLESDCQYRKLQDEEFQLFDFVSLDGKISDVLREYFSCWKCDAPEIRGYTSWYLDYQDISEEKMLKVLESVSSEEFDLFQIDDGFETYVGDWLDIDEKKFPNGLAPAVEKIHAKGLKAGIWLAPFVCESKSRTAKEHQDWLYRENGQEVYAGCNWSGQIALDIRKPEVWAYIKKCLEMYMDLGFDFFKLDFLYAAALIHEGGDCTRAQMMRRAMEGLREILKDRLILGCGVPLSSAFGLVDYCRVGPDISLKFDDVVYMRPMHRERISTKVTLLNTIYRSCMDGSVFRCDPDVFLLRDNDISLSREQRRAVVMLNHLCGSVFMTSDDIGKYDSEKRQLLDEARSLSGAKIKEISGNDNLITVSYELGGEESRLTYDRKRGVLI